MDGSVRIGRILGIIIALHYSWFLIYGAVIATLAMFYFPSYHPNWPAGIYWLVSFATATLFFVSVLLHELAHSVVAVGKGIPVKDITLFFLGGVSNIRREADSPMTELMVAGVGPATSITLAALFAATWYFTKGVNDQLTAMTFYLATTNGMLAFFNTIPGFPLDGGRLLRAGLWHFTDNFYRATRIASTSGRLLGYLFVVVGVVTAIAGNWLNGIWFIVIGWFLQSAAESSYQHSLAYSLLKGVSVGEVMTRDCPVVDEYLSVKELVEGYVSKYSLMAFPVVHGASLVGVVTLDRLKNVPPERWEGMSVSEVMAEVEDANVLHPSEGVDQALEQMGEQDSAQVPVVDGGRVVGLLSRSKIIQLLKIKEQMTRG